MMWPEGYVLIEGLLWGCVIFPQKLRGGEGFFRFELVFVGGISFAFTTSH